MRPGARLPYATSHEPGRRLRRGLDPVHPGAGPQPAGHTDATPGTGTTIGRALTVGRRDALVAASATAFTALKLVGAAYVVYLGIQAIRHRGDARAALDLPVHDRPATAWASVRTAMAVGVTNPKTIVFFAAFLPQFVDADHAASRARTWFAREPKRLDHLGVVGGVMMVGLGATLATSSS